MDNEIIITAIPKEILAVAILIIGRAPLELGSLDSIILLAIKSSKFNSWLFKEQH